MTRNAKLIADPSTASVWVLIVGADVYSERQYDRVVDNSLHFQILSPSEIKVWDGWADLGVDYAKKKVSPSTREEELMHNNPEYAWAFSLGFESALYRDPGPRHAL